jgi:geranylgeranyl pyrophosphate synthase
VVLTLLEGVGAREYSEEMAEAYYRDALSSLAETGIEKYALAPLHELAASLMNRET